MQRTVNIIINIKTKLTLEKKETVLLKNELKLPIWTAQIFHHHHRDISFRMEIVISGTSTIH